MPLANLYDIEITNTFTNATTEYNAVANMTGCRDAINTHYGCEMITKNGVCNLMTRGREKSPDRFAGIRIAKH